MTIYYDFSEPNEYGGFKKDYQVNPYDAFEAVLREDFPENWQKVYDYFYEWIDIKEWCEFNEDRIKEIFEDEAREYYNR